MSLRSAILKSQTFSYEFYKKVSPVARDIFCLQAEKETQLLLEKLYSGLQTSLYQFEVDCGKLR